MEEYKNGKGAKCIIVLAYVFLALSSRKISGSLGVSGFFLWEKLSKVSSHVFCFLPGHVAPELGSTLARLANKPCGNEERHLQGCKIALFCIDAYSFSKK